MLEFLGFGGYTRPAEGYLSWQHLLFVGSLTVCMIVCGIVLGLRNKHKPTAAQKRVLMVAAIIMDAVEIFKIVIFCWRGHDPMGWTSSLPLFLCSIQLITLPLAAFSKGRVGEAALDFVVIFGMLGAILGTFAAGNNYAVYPVLSLDNVASGITHTIAGFASLYILISGMASMRKKNIGVTFAILGVFCVAAYVANIFLDCNYMFLSRGDGTPYDILFSLVGGHPVLYPLGVVLLFLIYIVLFYNIYYWVQRRKAPAPAAESEKETVTVE